MKVNRIQNSQGVWLEEERDIIAEAVDHFQEQFQQERDASSFSLLSHFPEAISDDDNAALGVITDCEEVKNLIFWLNRDSAYGPDRLSGRFFQEYQDIVGSNIIRMVKDFFYCNTLPNSTTHTNLFLIPKKENVQTFSYMRPISLSSFVNKVLSRIIHDRLKDIIPKLISANETNFC